MTAMLLFLAFAATAIGLAMLWDDHRARDARQRNHARPWR